MELPWPRTLEEFNQYGKECLFEHLDMVFTKVEEDEVIADIPLQQHHSGWHGTLHAGTLFALADSCAGYGCVKSLPQDASGFTTIETKNNFLAMTNAGVIRCVATPVHKGRTTQVWDAVVSSPDEAKELCYYRCTQLILWPR